MRIGNYRLANALKLNRKLSSIQLRFNQIGAFSWTLPSSWFYNDSEIKEIAQALKFNYTLTSMDLSNNNIGFEGAETLIKSLGFNYSLLEIDLSSNEIEYMQAVEIERLLNRNLEYRDSQHRILIAELFYSMSQKKQQAIDRNMISLVLFPILGKMKMFSA